MPVVFSYKPEWKGVTQIDVLGGFGTASDWDPKKPFATLKDDGSGTWTASATLPAGMYLYVFHIVGDAAGPAMTERFAIDPSVSAYAPCPAASPTYSKQNSNPCSQVAVPQGAADPLHHVTGKVLFGGAAAPGYLVQLDREEDKSHHFFANRVDAAADGTFDLVGAKGKYRLQVLYPDFLSKSDKDRDPLALKALRRDISTSFAVDADVAVGDAEMAYDDYGAMTPTGTATLPTTFTFTVIAGAKAAKAAVYGTAKGMGSRVGDPWFDTAYGAATTAMFDGKFTTKQAGEPMVVTGENYFWGTWQQKPAGAAGTWQGESMVFPIVWK